MDAAVGDQLLEGQAGYLPAHPVEARQHHRRRGLVDDEVDPGEALQGADVAPVAADDPALHLVARQLHHAGCGLARLVGCEALHRDGEDSAGAAFRLQLRLLLHSLQGQRRLVASLVLDLLDEDLARLGGAEAGYPLQLAQVLALCLLELGGAVLEVSLAVVERLVAPLQLAQLGLHRLQLAQRPLLHADDLGPTQVQLVVDLVRRLRGRLGRLGALGIHGAGHRFIALLPGANPRGQHRPDLHCFLSRPWAPDPAGPPVRVIRRCRRQRYQVQVQRRRDATPPDDRSTGAPIWQTAAHPGLRTLDGCAGSWTG